MSNILNKLKKKKEENKILTSEELNNYEKRLYELKDLTILSLNEIKFNPKNKEAYERLNKYTDEIKRIKKILKNAQKVADKNGE